MFLAAPLPPPYWTGFDVTSNLIGIRPRWASCWPWPCCAPGWTRGAVWWAALAGSLLSLAMEFLQIYLPRRVPSNLDLVLNAAGTWLGALLAALLERWGAIDRWSLFRSRWFVPDARGALVLMALWPACCCSRCRCLLVWGRCWSGWRRRIEQALEDTPFIDWMPMRESRAGAAVARRRSAVRDAGLAGAQPAGLLRHPPCGAAGSVCQRGVLVIGVAVTALSAALELGPRARLGLAATSPCAWACGLAAGMAVLLLMLPRRASAAVLLVALVWHLALLNQAPTNVYFAQTLHAMGAGALHPFLWPGPVAGLALALCGAAVCAVARLAQRRPSLKYAHERTHPTHFRRAGLLPAPHLLCLNERTNGED